MYPILPFDLINQCSNFEKLFFHSGAFFDTVLFNHTLPSHVKNPIAHLMTFLLREILYSKKSFVMVARTCNTNLKYFSDTMWGLPNKDFKNNNCKSLVHLSKNCGTILIEFVTLISSFSKHVTCIKNYDAIKNSIFLFGKIFC